MYAKCKTVRNKMCNDRDDRDDVKFMPCRGMRTGTKILLRDYRRILLQDHSSIVHKAACLTHSKLITYKL